jgi:hypothetical protein
MANKLIKGQDIWVMDLDQLNKLPDIVESKVTTVGTKYFSVAGVSEKFFLEDLKMYSSTRISESRCFLSLAEFLDHLERVKLHAEFSLLFQYRTSLTIDQLRRIKAITDEQPVIIP